MDNYIPKEYFPTLVKAAEEELDKLAALDKSWANEKKLAYLKGVLHEIFLRTR
jgi:hypothetical protein